MLVEDDPVVLDRRGLAPLDVLQVMQVAVARLRVCPVFCVRSGLPTRPGARAGKDPLMTTQTKKPSADTPAVADPAKEA
ncbi:MAG TPA: hypothetical protein VK701_05925, partial [Solirubrobacteraceae bacterium]|nr:hypothetical protein [Solirubrobacteraceae bacterium]